MTTPRELVNSFYESIIKGDMELYNPLFMMIMKYQFQRTEESSAALMDVRKF